MTSTYTSAGITLDRYADILTRLIALAEAQWGTTVNTAEDEILGHILRNIALLQGEINEVVQSVYDGYSITNSSGTQLDGLVELVGLERQSAAYSTITLSFTSTETTTVPAGTQVSSSTTGLVFATDSALSLTGVETATVAATCTVTGENNVAADELDTLDTPVFGVDTTVTSYNLTNTATPGRDRETDSELKARHTNAVAGSGTQDTSSIYAAVSEVPGVSNLAVTENDTNATVDSVPAHSVYVVVYGGSDDDVATAIANNITAGVATYGTDENIDVYNSTTGQTKTINFDRATAIPIYVKLDYTAETGVFPSDGESQISDALVAYFATLDIGEDVVFNKLYRPIYGIPGVDINNLYIKTSAPADAQVDISIAADEIATLVAANITFV